MPRTIMQCRGCGEVREMLAHELCAKCYRREERERNDLPWPSVSAEKHNRSLLKKQKRLRKVLATILNALDRRAR